jgi:hypothetical protein
VADNISTLLSQVATIASVRGKALGMSRLDKDASKQSERAHNAKEGIARVSVSRLAGAEERVKEIISFQNDARTLLAENTTAWGDRRLLPNSLLEKFMHPWSELKREHDEKVEQFVAAAPQLIASAETNKGNFNVQIPTLEEIEKAFDLSFNLEPVPDVSTYKSGNLDKAVEKVLKERFEANIKAAYTEAQADAVQRLAKPLENLVNKMTAFNERESAKVKGLSVDKSGTFRDTIIGNIQEIAEVFGEWNLTNDPIMKRLDDQLSAFGNIAADDLRNSEALRNDVSARAAKILDEIRAGGFL